MLQRKSQRCDKVTAEKGPLIAGTGLTALDRIYAEGREQPMEALGGSCGNVLASLAMLGHSVAPVVALGDDHQGEFLVREFRRAGCDTRLVFRMPNRGSPIIVEHVDPRSARHWFSFRCPETSTEFPRWHPIADEQVQSALGTIERASVFYVDRLSPSILTAMEAAHQAGAIVFFEPASKGDPGLLRRALTLCTVAKLSDETSGANIGRRDLEASSNLAVIRTHGARGLTANCAGIERFFPAQPAPRLVDTCGSGDMVTTGLIDHLMHTCKGSARLSPDDFFAGIAAGQSLASLNCAFAGARGLFLALGGTRLRSGLDDGLRSDFIGYVMSHGPYDGY